MEEPTIEGGEELAEAKEIADFIRQMEGQLRGDLTELKRCPNPPIKVIELIRIVVKTLGFEDLGWPKNMNYDIREEMIQFMNHYLTQGNKMDNYEAQKLQKKLYKLGGSGVIRQNSAAAQGLFDCLEFVLKKQGRASAKYELMIAYKDMRPMMAKDGIVYEGRSVSPVSPGAREQ